MGGVRVPVGGAQHDRVHPACRRAAELVPSPIAHVQAVPRGHSEQSGDGREQLGVRLPPACLAGQHPGVDESGYRQPRPRLGKLRGAVAQHAEPQPAAAYLGQHRERIFAKDEQLILRRPARGARSAQGLVTRYDAVPASKFAERCRQVAERAGRAFCPRLVQRTPPGGRVQPERGGAPRGVVLPDVLGCTGGQRPEEVEDDRGKRHVPIVSAPLYGDRRGRT